MAEAAVLAAHACVPSGAAKVPAFRKSECAAQVPGRKEKQPQEGLWAFEEHHPPLTTSPDQALDARLVPDTQPRAPRKWAHHTTLLKVFTVPQQPQGRTELAPNLGHFRATAFPRHARRSKAPSTLVGVTAASAKAVSPPGIGSALPKLYALYSGPGSTPPSCCLHPTQRGTSAPQGHTRGVPSSAGKRVLDASEFKVPKSTSKRRRASRDDMAALAETRVPRASGPATTARHVPEPELFQLQGASARVAPGQPLLRPGVRGGACGPVDGKNPSACLSVADPEGRPALGASAGCREAQIRAVNSGPAPAGAIPRSSPEAGAGMCFEQRGLHASDCAPVLGVAVHTASSPGGVLSSSQGGAQNDAEAHKRPSRPRRDSAEPPDALGDVPVLASDRAEVAQVLEGGESQVWGLLLRARRTEAALQAAIHRAEAAEWELGRALAEVQKEGDEGGR